MKSSIKRELLKEQSPIFIWGASEAGKLAYSMLVNNGISPEGFVVDKGYSLEQAVLENGERVIVREKDDVINSHGEYILVRAVVKSFFMSDEEILSIWPGCKKAVTLADVYDGECIDEITQEYYEENIERFNAVRSALADRLSVESLDAYLYAKVHKDNVYILDKVVSPPYFFEPAPWFYSPDDILIDGGAYDGDSIRDFIKLRGAAFEHIIACEPDPENYEKLKNDGKDFFDNISLLKTGLYSEKNVLRFKAEGTMGTAINSNGNIEIPVDSIDSIAAGKRVTIIKMDIEKAELDAIKGAKNTIVNCRPILMVSAYHKRNDVFELFEYVSSIVDNYKFFFRLHRPFAVDAVLYCVPIERLK